MSVPKPPADREVDIEWLSANTKKLREQAHAAIERSKVIVERSLELKQIMMSMPKKPSASGE